MLNDLTVLFSSSFKTLHSEPCRLLLKTNLSSLYNAEGVTNIPSRLYRTKSMYEQ